MKVQHLPEITPYTKPPTIPPPTKPNELTEDHSEFRSIKDLPKANHKGTAMLVRGELVNGGIHRLEAVVYRIVSYENNMAYDQYFRGLKNGEVVTHWMPLPMMDQDKGKYLYYPSWRRNGEFQSP